MVKFICLVMLAAELLCGNAWCTEAKRPITASDCVKVRDILRMADSPENAIHISPDGKRLVYAVRSPDLDTNENRIEIYVKNLDAQTPDGNKPVLTGDFSSIRWMLDGVHLSILAKEHGLKELDEVNADSGERRVLVRADEDIAEYSIDRDAKTIVYATDIPFDQSTTVHTAQEIARGYRIPFQTSESEDKEWLHRKLFFVRWTGGRWSTPQLITMPSPLDGRPLDSFAHAGNDSLGPQLSPDGTKVLFRYTDTATQMPEVWRATNHMKLRQRAGVIQGFLLLVMYDLTSGQAAVPLKTTFEFSFPRWSDDSKTFFASGYPVAGSEEEKALTPEEVGNQRGLYFVNALSGTSETVALHLVTPWEGAMYEDADGSVFARVGSSTTIARFARVQGKWAQQDSFQIPLSHPVEMATNGRIVVGTFSDTLTPPELFQFRPGDKKATPFAVLNPQFDQLTLAPAKEVHWKTSAGYPISGVLLLPPNYVPGEKYPLVIQTKPFGSFFTCSFGDFPSFAPQPIANAGIMYLGQGSVNSGSMPQTRGAEVPYPKNYPGYAGPGGIAEAAFSMDIWDSGVEALAAQGLVDKDRVGIIGFSRTGWYTEFILAHSRIKYRAATVTDNVQYSLGEYWMLHDSDTISSYENAYGGPPYGATLKNWIDYSVSFNIDKIHAPVLMEQMGDGITKEISNFSTPLGLAASYEVFAGLSRLHNPVELYFYPNEDHTPSHPAARLATLERNVDWYRFWLQGYERPNPEDPDQYKRWEQLKELRDADLKTSQPASDARPN